MADPAQPPDGPGEAPDPLEAIDDDSPAQVRKTFVVLLLAGGVLLLLPRQYWSAAILFGLALAIGVWHWLRLRRERSRPARAEPTPAPRPRD
jgi:hypothetical protein